METEYIALFVVSHKYNANDEVIEILRKLMLDS